MHLIKPIRFFTTSAFRQAGHGYPGGIPGKNLPFSLKMNKVKFTVLFGTYFGIGLAAPFLVVWHQLHKK